MNGKSILKSIVTILGLILTTLCTSAQILVPSNKPNPTKEALILQGYGMFIHFGVNTFIDVE